MTTPDYAVPWRQPFPFFVGSPWRTRVDGLTDLDPNSPAICAYLNQMLTTSGVGSAQQTPVYYVPPNQPNVPVTVLSSPWNASTIDSVPIPPGAQPSPGSDHYLLIVQQVTENEYVLWELWVAEYAAGEWSCRGGIRREHLLTSNPGYSRNVQTAAGVALEQPTWGVAASKLSLGAGMLQIAELQLGEIDHALAFVLHDSRKGQWAFPAQGTDGSDTNTASVPYGAHFRLDPTLDIPSLGLSRAIEPLAIAAQRYGIIPTDRTLSGSGFQYETTYSGQTPAQGYSLWSVPPFNNVVLTTFPWAYLQLLPMDLRTVPDMTLFAEPD